MIISESVARRMFKARDVLDRHLMWTDPVMQFIGVSTGGRLFVHATGDPYALVKPITGIIRSLAPDQPVERAATLEDVRAEVLAPDRLNALMFGGFAG